jgi:hypothetical protein
MFQQLEDAARNGTRRIRTGFIMHFRFDCLLVLGLIGPAVLAAQQPFSLVQSIEMPEVPAGPYAHGN